MTYFKDHPTIKVVAVVTNNPLAGVLSFARFFEVQTHLITNEQAADALFLTKLCREEGLDYVILAGYLRMIPEDFIHAFEKRIINIHPSLLPKFGGQGMYGDNVHKAVISAGEKKSGITVHFVNTEYDKGEVIAQAYCVVSEDETTNSLRAKIAKLEKEYFPRIIEKTILG